MLVGVPKMELAVTVRLKVGQSTTVCLLVGAVYFLFKHFADSQQTAINQLCMGCEL